MTFEQLKAYLDSELFRPKRVRNKSTHKEIRISLIPKH
jgi:hypothetical protein